MPVGRTMIRNSFSRNKSLFKKKNKKDRKSKKKSNISRKQRQIQREIHQRDLMSKAQNQDRQYKEHVLNDIRSIQYASFQADGYKSPSEDFISIQAFPNYLILAVFDGHGGQITAQALQTRLIQKIHQELRDNTDSNIIWKVLKKFSYNTKKNS